MLNCLHEAVRKTSGFQLNFQRISKDGFRHAVKFTEARSFMAKLSPRDLEIFHLRSTFSVESPNKDERSIVLPLNNPIMVDGRTIFALRLKGVFPRTSGDGTVEAYSYGKGFVGRIIEVQEKDVISGISTRFNEYLPRGTMDPSKMEKEIIGALMLGPENTDLLLGYGEFEYLSFNGQPVGFVVYGMERTEDSRVFKYITSNIQKSGKIPGDGENIAFQTGLLLRKMHEDYKLVHGYPHLGNFGINPGASARILDLETSAALADIPIENRPAFLYLDLARTINDLMKDILYTEMFDGEPESSVVFLTPLLPHFLWGYFRGDNSLSFVKDISKFMESRCSTRVLAEVFGVLPSFDIGYRFGGDDRTLIEPIVQAYSKPENIPVNLLASSSNPLFVRFYDAISIVAAF